MQYRAQHARLDIQRAQVSATKEALLPRLSAQTLYRHEFVTEIVDLGARIETPVRESYGAGAAVTWPIGDVRAFHAIGTASAELRAAEHDVAAQHRAMLGALADGLTAVVTSKASAKLAREALETAAEVAELTRKRLHYGQVLAVDVTRAEQDMEQAHGQTLMADDAVATARETLGAMLGDARGLDVSEELTLGELPRAVAKSCRSGLALGGRPAVAAARERIGVARRRLAAEWLALLPTLGVESNVAYSSRVSYGPETTWNLQAIARWSLYDGARYSKVTAARAEERAAIAAAEQTEIDATLEALRSERKVSVAAAQLASVEREAELAEAVFEDIRKAYASGLRTVIDLVLAAQARRVAALGVTQARAAAVRTKISAMLATSVCTF